MVSVPHQSAPRRAAAPRGDGAGRTSRWSRRRRRRRSTASARWRRSLRTSTRRRATCRAGAPLPSLPAPGDARSAHGLADLVDLTGTRVTRIRRGKQVTRRPGGVQERRSQEPGEREMRGARGLGIGETRWARRSRKRRGDLTRKGGGLGASERREPPLPGARREVWRGGLGEEEGVGEFNIGGEKREILWGFFPLFLQVFWG